MSESDGLHKLTAYLNQTRRQAEAAVDALNEQISDLRDENEKYALLVTKVEEEKDYYKSLCEKMKQESTIKHRLQERDEWKSLIENVQRDRSRLQDLCNNLETELDNAKYEITELKTEIDRVSNGGQALSDSNDVSGTPRASPSRMSTSLLQIDCEREGEDPLCPPMLSPVLDRNGNALNLNFNASPALLVRQLKLELRKAYAQVRVMCNIKIEWYLCTFVE